MTRAETLSVFNAALTGLLADPEANSFSGVVTSAFEIAKKVEDNTDLQKWLWKSGHEKLADLPYKMSVDIPMDLEGGVECEECGDIDAGYLMSPKSRRDLVREKS